MNVEEFVVTVADHPLQVRVAGDAAQGPTVLLVNGLGAHTRMWSPLEQSFGGGRLISFDAPGSGRSPTPHRLLTIPFLARLAQGVLDHLEVESADVVGYSMGGVIAQELAIQSPHRVRRLVLVTTSVGIGAVPGGLLPLLNLTTPLRYHVPWFYRHTIGGLAGGRARTDADWVSAHGELRHQASPTLLGYALQLLGLVWTTLGRLREVDHPVLVVAGDDDPLIPAQNAYLLTGLLPRSRGVVLAGEGHLMIADDQSGVHDLVRDFLTAADVEESAAWRDGFAGSDGEWLRERLRHIPGEGPRPAQPWAVVYGLFRKAHGVG